MLLPFQCFSPTTADDNVASMYHKVARSVSRTKNTSFHQVSSILIGWKRWKVSCLWTGHVFTNADMWPMCV